MATSDKYPRTALLVRLRLELEARRAGGDLRPAAEVVHEIVERYIARGLIHRQDGRLYFGELDETGPPVRKGPTAP